MDETTKTVKVGRRCRLNFENLTRHVARHRHGKRAGGHRVRFPAAFAWRATPRRPHWGYGDAVLFLENYVIPIEGHWSFLSPLPCAFKNIR